MKTIHKFPLQLGTGVTTLIKVPRYAELAAVGLDTTGVPVVWVKLDTDKPFIDELQVTTVYTGHPIPPDKHLCYKDTFHVGSLTYHVFYSVVTSIK